MLIGIGFYIEQLSIKMILSKKIKQFIVGVAWIFLLCLIFIGCTILALLGSIKLRSY